MECHLRCSHVCLRLCSIITQLSWKTCRTEYAQLQPYSLVRHLFGSVNRLLIRQMPLIKLTGMTLNLVWKAHLSMLIKRSICANTCKACMRPVVYFSTQKYYAVQQLSWAKKQLRIVPNCSCIQVVLKQQLKLRSFCSTQSSYLMPSNQLKELMLHYCQEVIKNLGASKSQDKGQCQWNWALFRNSLCKGCNGCVLCSTACSTALHSTAPMYTAAQCLTGITYTQHCIGTTWGTIVQTFWCNFGIEQQFRFN